MTLFQHEAMTGRRVWIVGASTGIGAALAEELSDRGARVAVSARRIDDDTIPAGAALAVRCDVTDPADVEAAFRRVQESFGSIDIVVWSVGYWRRFDATTWDREEFARHVAVNLLGLNNVLATVVPAMVTTGQGWIVGIASVAGYRGLSGAEAYGATKAAQIHLLESLRATLRGKGIRVTTVCPGFVDTRMTAENDFPMPFLVTPQQAATAIADGLRRGQDEIVFPLRMAAVMKTARLLPVSVWSAVSSRIATRESRS